MGTETFMEVAPVVNSPAGDPMMFDKREDVGISDAAELFK